MGWLSSLRRLFADLSGANDDEDAEPSPGRMKGREPLGGIGTAIIVALVGVLDLVVTTGAGAPAHPTTWAPVVGILLAIGLVVAIIWYRNRLLSPFLAIFAAFFVTLTKAPNSLELPHLAALIVAVAFAVLVSLHQRRDQRILTPTPADRRAATRRRRNGEPDPPTKAHPTASRRYTPPKAKKNPRR